VGFVETSQVQDRSVVFHEKWTVFISFLDLSVMCAYTLCRQIIFKYFDKYRLLSYRIMSLYFNPGWYFKAYLRNESLRTDENAVNRSFRLTVETVSVRLRVGILCRVSEIKICS
jgi:hypothetical protein